jgi:hypothetical protein
MESDRGKVLEKLRRDDLYSLEQYARVRPEFRTQVISHKKHRQVQIGPHARLYFEDRLTMQYQVQEMLRIERIFEPEAIAEELDAYNPLIPDGTNWKATFMMEYEQPAERLKALAQLVAIEDRVWVQVNELARVWAIADEDLKRNTDDKTSSVHFLRFELSSSMIAAVKGGADIRMGIDHDRYRYQVDHVEPTVRESLAEDFA